MSAWIPVITAISSALIAGFFSINVAKINAEKTLKQKMKEKDLEKENQKEDYEERIDNLILKHEQEVEMLEKKHQQDLEKLEKEADIKLKIDEDSRLNELAFNFLTSKMTSPGGDDIFSQAILSSLAPDDPVRQLFETNPVSKQSMMNRNQGFNNSRRSNSRSKKKK